MNICVDDIDRDIKDVIRSYDELNSRLKLDEDSKSKFEFDSQDDLISTLVSCRKVITETLKLYTYLSEDEVTPICCEKTRDLYKRAGIRVTYAIIYHDLKNVFEIIDIAASDKRDTITLVSVTNEDLENVYVAMISFMLQMIKAYDIKYGVGGAKKYGARKRRAAPEKVQ